jgi:hypothetical protein
MKGLIESLSFGSGAFLIAIFSAGIVALLCFACPRSLHKVWVVIVPLVLSYCLYWSPAWLADGSEFQRALIRSEYHAWAPLFIGTWFLAGAIPSAAIVGLLRKRGVPNARS